MTTVAAMAVLTPQRRLLAEQGGVVHGRWDALVLKRGLHRRSVLHLHRVLGENAGVAVSELRGGSNPGFIELEAVGRTNPAPGLHFLLEVGPFGQKNRGLKRVDPSVHADIAMEIAPLLAVPGDAPHPVGQFRIVRKTGSAIAIATQGLGGKKAGGADRAQAAAEVALLGTAEALGAVFNHRQAMPIGNRIDRRKISRLPVQAHRNNRLGARADRLLELGWIEVVAGRIDIHVHRRGAKKGDRFRCGNEGKRCGDDLIAGPHAQRHQGYQQGIGAAGHGNAVVHAHIGRKGALQLLNLRAEDVAAVVEHRGDAGIHRLPNGAAVGQPFPLLRFKVNKLHEIFSAGR